MPHQKHDPQRIDLPERFPHEPMWPIAAYASESVPGQIWLVFATEDDRLICSCRGFNSSRDARCIHTEFAQIEMLMPTA